MFRDLKEYQEIAKIYAEKVSKPENLDERVRGGGMSGAIKPFEKPAGSAAGSGNVRGQFAKPGISLNKPMNSGAQGRTRPQPTAKPETDSTGKVIPSTASIRAAAAAKRGGVAAVGGGNAGASTDSGGTSKSTIKSVPVEKEKPEVSTMTKQGKPRTKAQMMAAKRIGSGTAKNPDTTIAQVKKSNEDSMRARAKERFAAFKAKRAEKKAAMVAKEELTPYDYVLEYLLSSEQVATIEEANYVMTEMDAETIQGIVEAQKKTLIEKPDDGYIGPKFLGIKTVGQRRKEHQLDANLKRLSKTGDSPDARTMLNIPLDYEITPEQKKKYGFK